MGNGIYVKYFSPLAGGGEGMRQQEKKEHLLWDYWKAQSWLQRAAKKPTQVIQQKILTAWEQRFTQEVSFREGKRRTRGRSAQMPQAPLRKRLRMNSSNIYSWQSPWQRPLSSFMGPLGLKHPTIFMYDVLWCPKAQAASRKQENSHKWDFEGKKCCFWDVKKLKPANKTNPNVFGFPGNVAFALGQGVVCANYGFCKLAKKQVSSTSRVEDAELRPPGLQLGCEAQKHVRINSPYVKISKIPICSSCQTLWRWLCAESTKSLIRSCNSSRLGFLALLPFSNGRINSPLIEFDNWKVKPFKITNGPPAFPAARLETLNWTLA